MFKNAFLFNGRIRRTEFGLSIIIFYFTTMFFGVIDVLVSSLGIVIRFLFFALSFWFILAQSVKRSHDLGKSSWDILLPFYNPFFLLFSEGVLGKNEYGEDPKKRVNFFDMPNSHTYYSVLQTSPLKTKQSVTNNSSDNTTSHKI